MVHEGEDLRIADLKEGSFFGEGTVIYNSPSTFSYVALNYKEASNRITKLYSIEAGHFRNILTQFPSFASFVKYRAMKRTAYYLKIVKGMRAAFDKNMIKLLAKVPPAQRTSKDWKRVFPMKADPVVKAEGIVPALLRHNFMNTTGDILFKGNNFLVKRTQNDQINLKIGAQSEETLTSLYSFVTRDFDCARESDMCTLTVTIHDSKKTEKIPPVGKFGHVFKATPSH